jgi:type IV secretion system protein VirB8
VTKPEPVAVTPQDYVALARHWHDHHGRLIYRSERRAWCVVAGLMVVLTASLAAWLVALPLKKTEPFLVRVDSSSGRVDVIPVYQSTEPLPEAVTRHLITEYVQARERYIAALAEVDYVTVGALQTAALNTDWANTWARSNPSSPLNQFADGSSLTVEINSITFLKDTPPYQIQVRFKQTHHQTHADVGTDTAGYVATLTAEYQNVAQDPSVRALNPLGFKVTEYRKEAEVSANNHANLRVTHE